ncbi:hypothetical protein SAMN05660776_2982 [Salegentibacter holothuriorum]|uniref:Uncharacterized protein n=1 Tax=Salegentibacter holothuriorum TaxID=241145 RepID=A0A1T5E2W7_9FLAO|nr:hypothetical protein [Salegentibacter holothuriorum]SKB78170.1 hypothetical protein SAMN05660776_2982 [Salegentibacter holothuriorum]
MKKYLKPIGLSLIIAFGFASCDTDDGEIDNDLIDLGGYATLSDNSITRLDRNADLNIKLFTAEGVSVESVEILQDGSVIGEATVSGETATFNSSILGDFTFTDEDGANQETGDYPITIRSMYSNGNMTNDPFSIGVGKAISLGDNPSTTTMDSLSSVELSYEVSTFSAGVDEVTLELKKNSDGTYADSDADLSTEEGTVELSETNYTDLNLGVNDTLYYRFTAMSGSLTDVVSSEVAITPKAFQNSNAVTLSKDLGMNQLNLQTGAISADGVEGADIRFLAPTGFEVINDSGASFVKADNSFNLEDADVLSARAAFENGNEITSATNLVDGDLFIYKDTRDIEDEDGNVETQDFYGVFEIGNVTSVNGNVASFDIEYSDGF